MKVLAYDLTTIFSKLTEQEKIVVLGDLAFHICESGRSVYTIGSRGLDDPIKMRSINELLLKVVGQLNKLMSGQTNRYSDDVFFKMLCAAAEEGVDIKYPLDVAMKKMEEIWRNRTH